MRRHLDERADDMRISHLSSDALLAVHAVHQAHDHRVLSHGLPDTVHCAGQRTVFQADHEKVHPVGLLRCPDLRAVGPAVDANAVCPQPRGAFALGQHPQPDARLVRQTPDHIRTHGTGSQNRHSLHLHSSFPLVLYCAFILARSRTSLQDDAPPDVLFGVGLLCFPCKAPSAPL